MDTFIYLGLGIAVCIMGAYDGLYRRVPDIFASLFWLCFTVVGVFYPPLFMYAVIAFTGFYLFNVLFAYMFGTVAFGWMDIIILPPVFAIVYFKLGLLGVVLVFGTMLFINFVSLLRRTMENTRYGLMVIQAINIDEEGEPLIFHLILGYAVSLILI